MSQCPGTPRSAPVPSQSATNCPSLAVPVLSHPALLQCHPLSQTWLSWSWHTQLCSSATPGCHPLSQPQAGSVPAAFGNSQLLPGLQGRWEEWLLLSPEQELRPHWLSAAAGAIPAVAKGLFVPSEHLRGIARSWGTSPALLFLILEHLWDPSSQPRGLTAVSQGCRSGIMGTQPHPACPHCHRSSLERLGWP